jgi:endogenous inhibitor of DNA gyrase (YacG/DUF329 family)
MARVMIECPDTGKPVYTHLNFEWIGDEAIPLGIQSVPCPICGKVHEWTRKDSYLEEDGCSG